MRGTRPYGEIVMQTPWGESQTIRELAPGVTRVTTAGHGGIRVTGAALKRIPDEFRRGTPYSPPGWYEEDCDVVIVILAFPELFQRVLDNGQTIYEQAVAEANGYARSKSSYLRGVAAAFGLQEEEQG